MVKPAGGFCDICKMVVAYADKELEKNATTAEIEALLEKVCHFLPESVSEQVRCLCHGLGVCIGPNTDSEAQPHFLSVSSDILSVC